MLYGWDLGILFMLLSHVLKPVCDWFLCLFHSTTRSPPCTHSGGSSTVALHKLFMLVSRPYSFLPPSLVCLVGVLRCCWGGERSSSLTALLPCWARHPRSSGRMNADWCSQTERASLHKPGWRKGGQFNPIAKPKEKSSFVIKGLCISDASMYCTHR